MTGVLATVILISISIIVNPTLVDTTVSANPSQTQLDQLREEKREYELQKSEIQARIDAIEFQHMTEMGKKEVLDERITMTGFEIKNIKEIIDQYHILITEKENEIAIAQNREDAQLHKYRKRVRDMEENGVISYLEIIFDSANFSDLLARIDFVNDIIRADEKTYIDLQNARNDTIAAKVELEGTKAELEEEEKQLELKNDELLEQLEQAYELIRKIEEDIESESQLRDMVIAEEERVQLEINAAVSELRRQQDAERQQNIERQRAAEKLRRQIEQTHSIPGPAAVVGGGSENEGGSGSVGGSESEGKSEGGSESEGGDGDVVGNTGQLMWPVNGSIWSRFGPRNGRQHQGIDIGAPHGTNVVAADSGTVITSTYASGYGNYIVIAHGNGFTTLYAHLSSRSVSKGDSVTKGQLIGCVGSTGNAKGAHLHFEVSINGRRVDPETQL